MPRSATVMDQQGRGGFRRASSRRHRGRNNLLGKHCREESPQSGSHKDKYDQLAQGELRQHIIAISNLGAVAKFVLNRKPEIIPEVKEFTKEYPELLEFIQKGSCTEVIPQGDIPLLTEWDDDGKIEPAADEPAADEPAAGEPAPDEPAADQPPADEPTADEPPADEPTTDEPTADESGANEPVVEKPAAGESPVTALTPGTKEHMNPQIQEQIPSGRSIPVKMIKGAGLDGLPEPLPDAAAPPGSSSAWMSYAQHPSYVPSWLPIPDSMPMANTMPNGSNAQMFSTPFFFPSGSAVEYGFPPGTAPLGPLHAFQQPHNGQAIPQSGARLPSFTGYIPSTSRSGPSTEQVNPALSQSIQSGTGSRPDVEGLVPTQSGSQMPMEMNFCQPFSGQVRDVTLWPGSESDDYMTMMNELPGIIC